MYLERRRRKAGSVATNEVPKCTDPDHGRAGIGWLVKAVCTVFGIIREPKHVAQQMRYQNVDLSKGIAWHHYNFLT